MNASNDAQIQTRSWSLLKNMMRLTQERLDALLVPTVREALRKRNPKDLALAATEIERCLERLNQLKTALIAPPVISLVPAAEFLPAPALLAKVVNISSSNARPKENRQATKTKFTPLSSVTRPIEIVGEQPLHISQRVLTFLFYSKDIPRVNLSRGRLKLALPEIPDLDTAVKKAIDSARQRWRTAPRGSETEQKFIHFLSQLRFDYGDMRNFENMLVYVKQEDISRDPFYL